MFEPNLTSWRAQYNLMLRDYARLQPPHTSALEHEDALRKFLQDAWHLKDWIKDDPQSGIDKQRIEREVHAIPALRVLSDLATACKHRNHDITNRADAYVTGNDVTLRLAPDREIDPVHHLATRYGDTTAQQLAPDVIAAWDALLRKLGLTL